MKRGGADTFPYPAQRERQIDADVAAPRAVTLNDERKAYDQRPQHRDHQLHRPRAGGK